MGSQRKRWLGEFVVIVLGVLVALAVGDCAQYRSDRDLERDLVQRLRGDLVADAGDLALAGAQVARRRWLLDALSQVLSEGVSHSQPPDSLVRMERAAALVKSAGRGGGGLLRWDSPLETPLRSFLGSPQFDIADDTFQEMLATGALRTMRDHELRSAILAYYRTAEDMADALMHHEASVDRLTALLLESSIAIMDPLDLEQLAALAGQDTRLAAQVREARTGLEYQTLDLRFIEDARVTLDSALTRQVQR